VHDKFIGKRIFSPHPHPALPLKGRENSGALPLKGKIVSVFVRKSAKAEGFSPFKGEAGGSGFLPLQGGGRRGMGL